MNILEIKNLSKTFSMHILHNKRITALKDISFVLGEGEIIGLTGRSGSGKSTLMKCVYRTYLSTAGEIVYHTAAAGGNIDLATADDHTIIGLRKREITYCSQFLSVIPRVPAVDVVGDRLPTGGKAEKRALAKEILERLGLPEELWDAFPGTFSGGEQQRINIARAVISRPRLLLIDEPTASLDARTRDVVIDLILDLKKEGASVLCISHDEYTLERLTDRRLHLQHGQI